MDPDPEGQKIYTDPDPQHWSSLFTPIISGFGLQENQAEGARQRQTAVQDPRGEDAAEGHPAEGQDLRAGGAAARGNQQEHQRGGSHARTGDHFTPSCCYMYARFAIQKFSFLYCLLYRRL